MVLGISGSKSGRKNIPKTKLKNVLDALIKKSIDAMPCMDDDPDAYVKTISEVLKDPRQDKKIISNVVKEISINWKCITLASSSMHEVR